MTKPLVVTDTFTLDDPKLQAAGEQIKAALMVAADRAVLHLTAPDQYPIDPAPDSAEQLFLAHLKTRKPAVQQKAIAKTTASIGTAERAARLGQLVNIDLRSKTPVFQQAMDLLGIAHVALPRGAAAPPPPSDAVVADDANAAIRCRIRKVTCVDRTDPDIGDDDMIVGGAITNDKGKTFEIGQSKIGQMNEDDHQVERYSPPKVFATATLKWGISGSLEASAWPKAFLATVVLCEQDNGGFPDWLDKLLKLIEDKVAQWAGATLGAAIGSAIGTALFPGLGTAIGAGVGALIGWLLGGIIGFFESWWEDDVMPPVTTKCTVDRYHQGGQVTSSDVLHYTVKGQGGEYKLELDWQVNWPSHFADNLDCAVAWDSGKAYFFSGSKYVRYDLGEDSVDEGYPKLISDAWPGLWKQGVSAGILWNNGKAYFFKSDEYVRVDAKTKQVDPGYPKKIKDAWKGLWADGIDAALMNSLTGKAYFFKGDQYIRYDVHADRADPGYPAPIAGNWHGVFAKNIDAALNTGPYAYVFKGASYVRYNMILQQTETGVLQTDFYWPGL